jgi:hypothetical protein
VIGKHIDLLAIAVLLGGAVLYTGTRELALSQAGPYYKAGAFSQVIQRAMRCKRTARATRSIDIHRAIVLPAVPAVPPVSISTN